MIFQSRALWLLGGCPGENDAVPTAVEPLAEEHQYWHPKFDIAFKDGQCIKAGVNTNDVPPSYYTKKGGFLHIAMDECCEQWFEHQQGEKCLNAMDEVVFSPTDAQPSASMTGENKTSLVEVVVEPRDASIYHKTSQSALASKESL